PYIGYDENGARSERFEDCHRPLVLGSGEVGTRLQPEAAPEPETKPGRVALFTAPIQSGDPYLQVPLAPPCFPGKEMSFAQLAQHPGPLTAIGHVIDDPLVEGGGIRVGLVGFGGAGGLDGDGYRLVPVTSGHQMIGKIVLVRKELGPKPVC